MFTKSKYVQLYNKQHYRLFAVYLKPEEFQKIDEHCKQQEISHAAFVRKAMELMMK